MDKAKHVVDDRGGTDALKEDAGEVKEALTGEGSLEGPRHRGARGRQDRAPGEDAPKAATPPPPPATPK